MFGVLNWTENVFPIPIWNDKLQIYKTLCLSLSFCVCARASVHVYMRARVSTCVCVRSSCSTVWSHWLTSAVLLTKVWKSPHVSQSDCIRNTCQDKLSGVVPVGSGIFFHVCFLTISPRLCSTGAHQTVRQQWSSSQCALCRTMCATVRSVSAL